MALWRTTLERSPRRNLAVAGNIEVSRPDNCLPQLNEAVLHVWIFNLEVDREAVARQEAVLSADEWRRVRRYSSAHVARRFVVRRGLLRRILGEYLVQSPEGIRFVYNAYGKPLLAPEICSDLQFSLSDSGEVAALAVGLKDSLGIDIEQLQTVKESGSTYPFRSQMQDSDRYDGPASPTNSLPFVKAWTRREAVAKAKGAGLQMLPGQTVIDGQADYLQPTSTAGGALFGRGIHIHALTLPAGYVGAVAASQRTPKIVYFSL